jgi:hypothetical protein
VKLVESLASGISVAAVGTAVLNSRGTATRAQYYRDFEASQVYTTQPIVLDSSGSTVIYVNELVDVLVYDSTGTLVREFVAGGSAPAVEVISQSFTGTSYSDGSSGTSKPTTLQRVLDGWYTSAGAADFNVIPTGGTQLTLAQALASSAGLFFNVKTYGAIGNGTADDTAAITAAMTAAAATSTGGGTVFFPPGTYRATGTLTLNAGIKLLGAGGSSSKLMFDYGGGQNLQITTGAALAGIEGMYISAQTTATAFSLLRVTAAGRLHVTDCTIGGDVSAAGQLVQLLNTGGISDVNFSRCKFLSAAGGLIAVQQFFGSIARFVDCDFYNLQAAGITQLSLSDGASIRGCRFNCDATTGGSMVYISYGNNSGLYGPPEVIGNTFNDGVAVVPIAIQNALATPTTDVIEVGNTFGIGSTIGFTPTRYSYTLDGYAPIATSTNYYGWHGSRLAATERKTTGVLSADPKSFGTTVCVVSAGAALSVAATYGTFGDRWTLMVINTTAGAVTVTPNSAQIVLDAAAASFNVAAGGRSTRVFEWLPIVAGTTPGRWTQVSPGTNI